MGNLPQCVGKGQHGITNKLQLVFKVGIILCQLLFGRARCRVLYIIRSQRTVWVAALEVVLPEFFGRTDNQVTGQKRRSNRVRCIIIRVLTDKPRIALVVLHRQIKKVFLKPLHRICLRLD